MAFDNSYSRFVAWAKIVLPLVALGLLSTLFLFSKPIDPSLSLPYAKVDVEQSAREQQIKEPTYSGITSDGAAIKVVAETARPDVDNTGLMSAKVLTAELVLPSGRIMDIQSKRGTIDNNTNQVTLEGNVQLDTSDGYQILTQSLTSALGKTHITTAGTVQGTGPLGFLQAGQMELSQSNDAQYLLVFKKGVKLIYTP
ncbi:LPS export ABC transporter periplasmic protein LptC [Algirhabdus cladophorae]|uniref:LPS export ABC transporter periplasmic protein LptC n=1 Tax=Algirhabdus cladophorae TaxID=3377108 RepID=UPI003B849841